MLMMIQFYADVDWKEAQGGNDSLDPSYISVALPSVVKLFQIWMVLFGSCSQINSSIVHRAIL